MVCSHDKRGKLTEPPLIRRWPPTPARRAAVLEDSEDGLEAEAPGFLSVDPSVLQEEYDYMVVPGSMMAPDHDREAAKASADVQFAAAMPELHNLPYLVERYWQKRGIDPQRALTKPEERQQVRERLAQGQSLGQEGQMNGRGGGTDPTAFAFGNQ